MREGVIFLGKENKINKYLWVDGERLEYEELKGKGKE